jgi:hypothetical protein
MKTVYEYATYHGLSATFEEWAQRFFDLSKRLPEECVEHAEVTLQTDPDNDEDVTIEAVYKRPYTPEELAEEQRHAADMRDIATEHYVLTLQLRGFTVIPPGETK